MHLLDGVDHLAVLIPHRLAQRQYIIMDSHAHGTGHRCVYAQRFAHNGVEVGQCVQLVHRRILGVDCEKFFPEFLLCLEVLGQRIQCPCSRGTRI